MPATRPLKLLATAFAAIAAFTAAPPAHAADSAAATAAVTCATPTVPVYHVDGLGQLRRWSYPAPLDGSGASGWKQQIVGSGWGGLNVFSGGSGVLFTLDSSGDLRWYKDDGFAGGAASWDPGSGTVIGTGWSRFAQVFSGGQGVIYAIDASGDLYWYRYTGTAGSTAWAPGSGSVIGNSWGGLTSVLSGGDGIVFALDASGTLYWYRDQDPETSSAAWANGGVGAVVGDGWSRFGRIGSVGGGVLFAWDASGGLWWYRDTDPLGGTASWANGGAGVNEGSGWAPTQVVGDVAGCAASVPAAGAADG